jgi:predicted nuclease of predicted toxin-antitoxin system
MNISPLTVKSLQEAGWEVLRVSSVLSPRASDEEILSWARAEGRVLITQDLDFSRLLALGGNSAPSVINVRLLISDPDSVSAALTLQADKLERCLTRSCAVTVDDRSVRVRRLPILGD